MIRSALIALGLGAGAASALLFGATTARAQGMVRAAVVIEVCGDAPTQHAEASGDATVGPDPDDLDAAQAMAVDLPRIAVQPVPADGAEGAADFRIMPVMRASMQNGTTPFYNGVVFHGTMNGSDPSAGFCP